MTFEAQFQIGTCSYTVRAPDAKGVLDLTAGLQAAYLTAGLQTAIAQPTSPHDKGQAAIATLEGMGYSHHGGVLWVPPIGEKPAHIENESAPWYPDDSGQWVEIPDHLMGLPMGLSSNCNIEVLVAEERKHQQWASAVGRAGAWTWSWPARTPGRIVAFKVVQP